MTTMAALSTLKIPLERDLFLRALIRELAGILEDVVGYDEALGYISLVGQHMGEWINDLYKKELGVLALSSRQVTEVMLDLMKRIKGEFSIAYSDDHKIILHNQTCPFEDKVVDRPSMCVMTSNVLGVIAAENLGYAKVVLEKTLAKRDNICQVLIYLSPSPEADRADGREYFRSEATR